MIRLKEGVKWPCEISMFNEGFFMRFYKFEKKLWEEPLYEDLNLVKYPVVRRTWKTIVVEKKKLNHNVYLIGIRYDEPVYNYISVTQHINIMQEIKGNLSV